MSNFNNLDERQKRKFAQNCVRRRTSFEAWTRHCQIAEAKDILIIADRPGPKAPQTDDYHHTPFYSKLHSGGWLNASFVLAEIEETRLMWVNSATWDNKPEGDSILKREWKHIIALGGNAEKYLKKNGVTNFWKFDHPQYAKRWKSSEPYLFVSTLKTILESGSFETD